MYDEDEFGPSKTSLKKDADKAQALGMQLLTFNETFLQSLGLEEVLFDAIMLAKNIRQHGGKRRQLQLVGKLMRRADIDAIAAAVNAVHSAKAHDRQKHHRAERLRDSLIKAEGPERERLLSQFSAPPPAELNRLLKDTDHYDPGSPAFKKSSRNLFRLLFDLLD